MSFDTFWAELRQLHRPTDSCLVTWATVPSTHRTARAAVTDYADEGREPPRVDIVAWGQTGGHGREQRSWVSPPGAGVYLSLIRSATAADTQRLPLLVAIAVADTLNRYLEGRCRLKWPNDLMVGTRKLGGLLIDAIGPSLILSLGVNVTADLTVYGELDGVTSLGYEGAEVASLAGLVMDLSAALSLAARSTLSQEQLLERYLALSSHQVGDRLRWHQEGSMVEGIFRGFDSRGFLRLDVDGAERLITAGSVTSP